MPLIAQNATISGTVSHSLGKASSANVYLKGTTIGTTTDNNGSFILSNVPAGNYVIVASFVTYESDEKNLSIKSNDNI